MSSIEVVEAAAAWVRAHFGQRPDLRVIDDLAAITDVPERTAVAAALVRAAEEAAKRTRAERNIAMLTLALPPYEWIKADIVRLAGISRGLFVRQEQRAPAQLPEVKGDPARAVTRTRNRLARYKVVIEAAREIRDEGIDTLLADGVSNADVARLTVLPTARIAQLRHPIGA